jgi:hypothetical protein
MKRKKTGKQSIQVSSFVTLERANAFKEFLLKNLGSGEVGETTIIESPPTSKANNNLVSDIFFPNIKEQDNWLDFIVPQASANLAGKLEYQVTQQFGDDGKIFPSISLLSPFHKIKLEATSEGIKVEGASLIAQQIVVIPADKFTPGKIDFNDYGGQMKKEADVVGELYLKPADLGIWDLTTLRTITGNSNISELIKPKSSVGNTWKPGDYLVLMSGGPSLNRNGQDEKGNPRNYGAYTLNLTTQIVDLLGMIGFVTDKKPVEVANSIAPILLDCGTQPNLSEFIKCFSKPDNNTKVAQALGLEEKEIIESVFGLLKFQGESAKKVAKNLGKTINIGDKVVTFSRYLLWADYQSREIINGVYFGKFTVTEQPPNPTLVSLSNATNVNKFEEVNIACGRIPSGKFYDLEFGSCHVLGSIAAKNYSTNWYEIAQSEGELTLISPGEETALAVSKNDQKQMTKFLVSCRYRPEEKEECKQPIDVKVLAQRYSGSPIRKMSVSCDSNPILVWGLQIIPRCTSQGTYIDIKSGVEYPLKIDLLNGKTMDYRPSLGGSSGYITSTGRSVEFTISPTR